MLYYLLVLDDWLELKYKDLLKVFLRLKICIFVVNNNLYELFFLVFGFIILFII